MVSMTSGHGQIVNIASLASIFGVPRKTLDDWLRRGMPVIQRGGRGKAWQIDTREALDWLVEEKVRLRPAAAIEKAPRPGADKLQAIGLTLEQLDISNSENFMPIDEYREQHGLDEEEWSYLCAFGFPVHLHRTDSGEVSSVVDVARAALWRVYFSIFVEVAGGNGESSRLGSSLREVKLAGCAGG